MFLRGQKGQKVKAIFWVKKVKRSRSLFENHENLLYLKHLTLLFMFNHLKWYLMHLKDKYHHIY